MPVCRIATDGKLGGVDTVRNVFTFSGGATPAPSASAIATWLDGVFNDALMSTLSTQFQIQRYIVEVPAGGGHWSYYTEHAYSKQGTSGSNTLPQQSAAVLVGITPSRRRGKKFIAGGQSANQYDGLIHNDWLAVLLGSAQAYTSPLVDGANTWDSGVCKKDGTGFLAFNGYRVDPIMGTQKRRKQGVGV